MSIYPSYSSRKKPTWCVDYSMDGKQYRKHFPRNPAVASENDPGFKNATKHADTISRTFGDERTFASMSGDERAAMIQLWVFLRRLEMKPDEVMEMIKGKHSKKVILAEGIDRFLRELIALKRSDRYRRSIKSTLSQFSDAFPGVRVDQITPENIQWWRDSGDFAPASRRSRLQDVKTFYKYATLHKWTAENPCLPVRGPKVVSDLPGILTPRQAAKLLRVAYRIDRKLCAWLALALFCGIRPEELEKLTWENVRLKERLVEVSAQASKTSRRRLVAIPENAAQWLKVGGDLASVRPGKDGKPKLQGVINSKKRFDRVRKKAGLFKNWPHDAMRHSAATYSYAMTDNAQYVAKQMGNTVDVLLRNYASIKTSNGILVTKELAEVYFAIVPPMK